MEQVLAKIKHLLRKAAAGSAEAIYLALGETLKAFPSQECANYFANLGYNRT
jgi:hypothetical protein